MANVRGAKTPPTQRTSDNSQKAEKQRLQREEEARLIKRNLEKESIKKQILEVCNGLMLGNSNDIGYKTAIAKLCESLKQLAGLSGLKLDAKISESPGDFTCLLKLLKAHRFGYCNVGICCEILKHIHEASGLLYSTQNKAGLLKELGELWITKASYDNAVTITEELVKLASELGDKKMEAEAHYTLCKTLILKGALENAKLTLEKCVQCSNESGDELTIGYSKFAMATVLYLEHNFKKALALEEEFLEIAQKLNNKAAECEVTLSMGTIYCSLFDIQKALNHFSKGSKLAEEIGNQKKVLETAENMASVYSLLGEYRKAYNRNKQMLDRLKNYEDKALEYTVLCNLSVDALILNETKESLELAKKSLVIAEELDAVEPIALAYGNIGLAQEKLGDFNDAIESFDKCLEVGKKINDNRIKNNSYCNLGRAYEGKGDKEKARDFYLKALNMEQPPSSHWCDTEEFRFSADYLLAKLSVGENDYATARKYFEQVVDRCEKYRKNVHDSPLKICFNDTQKKPFQYLQHVLLKDDAHAAALFVGEMGRGRDFFDKVIKEDQSKQLNTPGALLDLAKSNNQAVLFLSKLDVVEEMRIWFIAPDGKITSFGCPLDEWNKLLTNLAIAFNQTAPPLPAQLTHSDSPIDISGQALRSCSTEFRGVDTEVLSDDESGDESDNEYGKYGQENVENGDQFETNDAGNDKATSTTRGEGSPINIPNLIDKFSKLLVRPIERHLEKLVGSESGHKPELLIIPQGQTFNIPYAALHLENGEPLCSLVSPREAFSFHSYCYSTTLQQETEAKCHEKEDILIVGNPTGDLPFAEKEAKMLADKLKVTPLLKNSATRSEVLGRLSRATIIHFSCHGKTDGKSLILAPEGENNNSETPTKSELTVEDISNLRLQANMVVLSACNTARGKISCEGVLGLARAFIMAGAKSVLTALWSINDKSTEILMSKFYGNLKSSQPVVAAMANAMYEMKGENFDVTQWGSFKVLGANVKVFFEDDQTQM